MSVIYSQTAITARLNGVITTIGSAGVLKLRQGTTVVVSFTLGSPCGTASGGVLTFTAPITATGPTGAGTIDNGIITDSGGTTVISGLTVGIPLSQANIIISNGLNSTVIAANSDVQFLSGQITGS